MMHETEYAYAVARVRANELTLLSATDIEQIIEAEDYKQAMRRLSENGWGDIDSVTDYSKYLEDYRMKTWNLLVEIMEDIHELDALVIRNDMQNLKAALKCIISQHDPKELMVSPTVFNTEDILKAVDERMFEALPDCMQDVAAEAYDILTRTQNGQLADAVLDRRTLELILIYAEKSRSEMLIKLSEYICATANIKIALRCANTGKSKDFIETSIGECKTLDKQSLVEAACEGKDALFEYITGTEYGDAVDMLEKSTSAFEKWCDDLIMDCILPAKYKAFSVDPMVAYYLAKDAEIKTVRIILSAKLNHLPSEIIRERVRALYV